MADVIEKPLRATSHCRHYAYDRGVGPRCARSVSLEAPGATNVCMPLAVGCTQREEYTVNERKAWKEWADSRTIRMLNAIMTIPDGKETWGRRGKVVCPNCEGNLMWARAPNNGHIMAACSTPNCVEFMQ